MTREEAIDVLKRNYPSACFTDLCEAVEIAIKALSAQPDRKKGKWDTALRDDPLIKTSDCICSICGGRTFGTPDFCPNCGADMRSQDVHRD